MPSKKSNKKKRAAEASGQVKTSISQDSGPTAETAGLLSESEATEPEASGSSSPGFADPTIQAGILKDEGNVAFKSGRYKEATDKYSEAIVLLPSEPTYLTNRAAALMALKSFKLALADCQQAASLQSGAPSSKTLIRLARCHLALGVSGPALSVLREVLSMEPNNNQAVQLQAKALELEGNLRNFRSARSEKQWTISRIALDRCFQAIESEGGVIPAEWRCWRIEIELAKGNWDGAMMGVNDAMRIDSQNADITALRGLVLFLTAKLPEALQHALHALRLDPDNTRAKQLRQRAKAVEKLKEEGNTFFKSNRWNQAIEKYSEALEVVGESDEEAKGGLIRATLLSNRATTLIKVEKHDAALSDISTSLDLNPISFKALRTRSRIYMHLEQYESAVADFKTAIEYAQSEGAANDERALKNELRSAEVALKRSKTKDYYKILAVARDATGVDIKKAYRLQSLKHHPDKGGEEDQFKLVNEAYSVLSDPERRARYDAGEDEDGGMSSGGMGGMHGGLDPNDLANIFMQFGGRSGGFQFRSGGPAHGHGFEF